ncbi:hypothetical protein RYX36_030983 [Vicia faba]
MDIEQTVKDLQVQNSQFQETLLTLSKGQQELMTMIVAKNKTKKKVFINMASLRLTTTICLISGLRFKGKKHKNIMILFYSYKHKYNSSK